jgi:hypothetical protein
MLLFALSANAQLPGGAPGGINSALTKLFGKVTAFSARAEVQVLDKTETEVINTPMDFALLDKKIRVMVDMANMRNKNMPPGAATALKQMGMSQVTSIIRPDQKLIYIIYPDQQCYLTMPLPDENPDKPEKAPKIDKTVLGKETIDGHPCSKNKVIISDDSGQSVEAITWTASDLKDFPIQIQTSEKENTSIMRFRQIQFEKPDDKMFDPPASYTKYKDQQDLLMGLMKKGVGGTEAK